MRLVARQQFHLGFVLLWHGSLDEADEMLGKALAAAEALGDMWLQDQCLAYLTILYRLQGRRKAVEAYLPRLDSVARRVAYDNYVGVSEAQAAWLDYLDGAWEKARGQAEAALEKWTGTTYPLRWLAHLPLLAIGVAQERLPGAVESARAMLDPGEQRLPGEVEAVLEAAVGAWEEGDEEGVREALWRAVEVAEQHGYL